MLTDSSVPLALALTRVKMNFIPAPVQLTNVDASSLRAQPYPHLPILAFCDGRLLTHEY